jgi:hypothetical protein
MLDSAPPLVLTNLPEGPQTLEVRGRNSAGNWQATPYANATWTVQLPPPDADGDTLPDAWELANGLDPNLASDAGADPDGDGMTSLQEYHAGTHPNDAQSRLLATATTDTNGVITLEIAVVAGKTYQVQYSPNMAPGSWQLLQSLPPQPITGIVSVVDTASTNIDRRFYRVITP